MLRPYIVLCCLEVEFEAIAKFSAFAFTLKVLSARFSGGDSFGVGFGDGALGFMGWIGGGVGG